MFTAPSTTVYPIPHAPWVLRGSALVVIGTIPRRNALQLAANTGGKLNRLWAGWPTVLAFVNYTSTPVGAYHECVVSPGILWRQLPGMLVSHMPVDSERSRQGGRALWSLPKVMQQFQWNTTAATAEVTLMDEHSTSQIALRSKLGGKLPLLPIPVVPCMSMRGPRCQIFALTGMLNDVKRARITALEIPHDSIYAPLQPLLRRPHLALYIQTFWLRISQSFDVM